MITVRRIMTIRRGGRRRGRGHIRGWIVVIHFIFIVIGLGSRMFMMMMLLLMASIVGTSRAEVTASPRMSYLRKGLLVISVLVI